MTKGNSDRKIIGLLLFLVTPLTLLFSNSHYWAAVVPVGTAVIGLFSREDWENKLVTMAASAQGLGLMTTLLGLGQVIGPAIATHDVNAIGFGIAVKIEASVMGIGLSLFLNGVIAYRGSQSDEAKAH